MKIVIWIGARKVARSTTYESAIRYMLKNNLFRDFLSCTVSAVDTRTLAEAFGDTFEKYVLSLNISKFNKIFNGFYFLDKREATA